jgi:hypothetical protein
MLPSREEVLAKVDTLPGPPAAFEARWNGDTGGWFVDLVAVLRDGEGYRDFFLISISYGGDIRLFNGNVPPWPEARFAAECGTELATRFGVPFYFASPDYPEEDCPTWANQEKGYPCRICGVSLLQSPDCPWRGLCYRCLLASERETNIVK